jgi:hypothetical protein
MLRSVKTKWKGIIQKTPGINGKQVQVLIELSNNKEYDLMDKLQSFGVEPPHHVYVFFSSTKDTSRWL